MGLRGPVQHIVRRSGVFLAHEHLKPAAGPCNMRTGTTKGVGLDHGVYACRFQGTLGHLRFPLLVECLDYNKIGFAHTSYLKPNSAARLHRQAED